MTLKKCPQCKVEKTLENFSNRRDKEGNSSYCKVCTNTQTKVRQQQLKKRAVEYKGGKCNSCGYNKYQGALEFHHLDPKEKDFNISKARSLAFENIKEELDKCILLCSNCHKEIHANILSFSEGKIITNNLEKLSWEVKKTVKDIFLENIKSIKIELEEGNTSVNLLSEFYGVSSSYILSILNEKNIQVSKMKAQRDLVYKSPYPSNEELSILLFQKPSIEVAKDLGISDVALGKHCKKNNIKKPPRGYWAKKRAENK